MTGPLHRALGLTDDELGSIRSTLGREPNRDELATMTRYAQEDGLTLGRVEPESLFAASTLDLAA